ncbi:MAG TPA: YtxH domain-containing protein [Candidatus Polarisedimenticolaceae bacterium]|nr:YtxH domain-containing protein [Candidatus Polarisedimenticolaceae bacterium]
MYETRSFSGMNCTMAFIGGAVVGSIVALLTAPRTGRETRDALNYWTRDVADKASRLPRAVREAVDRGREAGRQAFTESYRTEQH